MADISQFKDTSGTVHDIRDASTRELAEYNAQNGVKNLLDLSYSYTYSTNGLTFNVDGKNGTITVNGTATANTFFNVQIAQGVTDFIYNKFVGKVLNGAPTGSSTSTYRLSVPIYNSSGTYIAEKYNYGGDTKLDAVSNSNKAKLTITVYKNAVLSYVVFRPMIREAFVEDNTFESFALSNSELTRIAEPLRNRDIIQAFDDTSLNNVSEGIISGHAATVAGKSGDVVVRTYNLWEGKMQIAEFADGTRKTRTTSGSIWGAWV